MKAAVLSSFGQPLTLTEVARPAPGPDDVLLQVLACGVCHSDLHVADGDQPALKAATKPALIPGHEVVGRVVECGANVSGLKVGDRVGVAWNHSTCGQCEPCLQGLENLCRRAVITGVMVDGGYAEYMTARASHALPIPDALSDEQAAPLFCAGLTVYRALKRSAVRAGQRVAVFGVGGLGHLAVQMAKAWGATVIALDVDPAKLALARELGASETYAANSPDDLKALRKAGNADVAVVTSAAKAAYDTALKTLRPGGTLAVAGLPSEPLSFPALALVGLEATIVAASVGTREDMRAVLDMAAQGQLRCLTELQPLEEVNAVLERMRRGQIQGRVVLRCCAGH
ncbi:alcohol dehydrogenase catalytic domain-containing protein [Ottowia testudinis]|uniref:alcohol dehydrogenase n=1 Tax=Ottowia testudinis TaxID=2816950 RepID=A0A975CG52_9BURK|nr:alcohol dehydrogenase catalytic domain-containing protein [Ottowia testudinis]QTD45785.1 alcohol dehydrogenase catalytic domain-containing protein [Ottowia testudinis]